MSATRSRYTHEFKLQAIKLVTEQNRTVSAVSTSLKIGKSTLEKWIKQYSSELDNATAKQGSAPVLSDDQQRIQQLEKQLSILTAQRDEAVNNLDSYKTQVQELTNAKTLREQEEQKRISQIESLTQLSAEDKKVLTQAQDIAEIDGLIDDLTMFFHGKSITYVDVGAYVGSVFMRMANSSKIKVMEAHLFEPNPENYALLEQYISIADIRHVHAYNHALGDKEQPVRFSKGKSMTKAISAKSPDTVISNTFNSQVHTLDSLEDSFIDKHIHFLKIDVEGFEISVLNGAKKMLDNQQIDVIYIEVGLSIEGTQQTYFAKIDELLQQHGYRIFKIYEQKNEWLEDSPLLRRCNFAYMSRKFSSENPYKKTAELYKLKQEVKNLKQELARIKKT